MTSSIYVTSLLTLGWIAGFQCVWGISRYGELQVLSAYYPPVIEVQYEPASRDEGRSEILVRSRRAVTALKERLWEDGVIPYVINVNITDEVEMNINKAIEHWENHTCIRFVPRYNETDYVEFAPGDCGCCSFVGRQGKGRQYVNLSHYCAVYGVAVHEIGHCIGFWHEHSRTDRDKFVRIQIANIKPERLENFEMKSAMDIDSLDQPYDYKSIMHYRRTTFSSNGEDTMVPLKEDVVIGQREALSPGDILQANILYNCPKPRCDEVFDRGAGNITSPNFPMLYYKDHNCTWLINASEDAIVRLTFNDIEVEPTDNCTFDFLEIRQGSSLGRLIGRLCGIGVPGKLLVKGPVWIQFISDVSVTMRGFNGSFQIVKGESSDQLQHDEFHTDGVNVVDEGSRAGRVFNEPDDGYFAYKTDCVKEMNEISGRVASPLSLAMSGVEFDCQWMISGVQGMHVNGIQIIIDTRIARLHEVKCLGDIYTRNKSAKHDPEDNNLRMFDGYDEHVYDCSTFMSSFLLKTDRVRIVWSSLRHKAFSFNYRIDSIRDEIYNRAKVSLARHISQVDYDECSTNVSRCEQLCINTLEGYDCGCRAGYLLEGNGYTCRPKLAQFTDLCNSKVTSSRGVITANAAPIPHDCYFEIIQPDGHRIHLVFSEMNIPQSEGCAVNNVEVSKGLTKMDTRLLYCGTDIPSPISSSSGYLKLHLHVESGTVPVPGKPFFVANIVAHPNPGGDRCYFRLRNEANFSSPNHPHKYPHRTACTYKLSVSPPYKVRLRFHAMDLEVTKRCMFDHVVVRNGRNRASPLIARYCGRKIPDDIVSRGRHLWIMFISDESHHGRGFSASFTTVNPDGSPVTYPTAEATTVLPTVAVVSTVESARSTPRTRRRKRKRRPSRATDRPTTEETPLYD